MIGIRAPGIGFEGAYALEATHTHNHAGRRVFLRVRDMHAEEINTLDQAVVAAAAAADVVLYSSSLSLANTTPVRVDTSDGLESGLVGGDAIVGVPLNTVDTQSVLSWVQVSCPHPAPPCVSLSHPYQPTPPHPIP